MRIHEFSKCQKISVRTLRYYVQINLLIPPKKDGQLFFEESCEQDLMLIEQLKSAGFLIKEIVLWMELERDDQLRRAEKSYGQRELLLQVKMRLEEEKMSIEKGMSAARMELQTIRELPIHNHLGIHVDFLSYLCCPHCGGSLVFEHVKIYNQELRSGEVSCQCGYRAEIQNGIFISDHMEHASLTPIDTNRETYARLRPEGINILHKNTRWLLKHLQSQSLKGKVIFESFVNTICFLSTNLQFLDRDAYYIVADSDYRVISDIKARIEALDIPVKLLFLVNSDLNYPICRHSVDLVLDYFHSEIIQGFGRASLEEAMLPYVHPGTLVAGIYTYVKKGRKTLENNRRMFPESHKDRFMLPALKNNMASCSLKALDEKDDDILTYSVIESYGDGDIMGGYCFFLSYK